MTGILTVPLLVAVTSVAEAQTDTTKGARTLDSLVVRGERSRAGYTPRATATPTKSDLPLLLVPQSTQVVPRTVLEDQAVGTIPEATKNVAGVGAAFGFMGVTNGCVRIRGFSTEQGSVGCTYYRNGTRVWAQPLPFATVEAIEVVKGPNTVLFGRNEPGGMVNVVTRRPSFTRIGSVQQTVGSFGTYITEGTLSGPLDRDKTIAGRITGGYLDTDTFRARAFERLATIDVGLSWLASSATQVDLSVDYARQVYQPDFGLPALGDRPAPVPIRQSYKQDYIDSKTTSLVAEGAASHRLNANWRVGVRGVYLTMKPRYFNVYGYGLDEQTRLYPVYYFAEQYSTRRTWQGVVDLNGTVRTGGARHDLLFGVDYFDEDYDGPIFFSDAAPPLDLDHPQIGSAPKIYPSRSDYSPWAGVARWFGVYWQDQVRIGDRVIVNVGLRHDQTRALFGDPTTTTPVTAGATKPRIGLVVTPRSNLAFYAQYQGALAPNNGRSAAGTSFPPQIGKQLEIGAKIESSDQRFLATIAAFDLRKQRLLTADLSTPDPTDQVAVGEVRNRGIEVDASGRVTERVTVIGSLALSDAKITKDANGNQGHRYEGVPRVAGSAWVRLQPTNRLAAGVGLFAEGRRAGDLGNTFWLPGYGRVDAMAQYRLPIRRTSLTAQVNLNNVFDTTWYAGVYNNSRDFILPGTPRQLLTSLRLEL
jgi:iron complex outermembrane receptor protein